MQHITSIRAQPTAWPSDDRTQFEGSSPNPPLELICLECGDDRGPFPKQAEHIKQLRSPYLTRHDAEEAANLHRLETG